MFLKIRQQFLADIFLERGMGIYRWNLPHVRQVKPEQFRIRNIGAALRFLDIVNQEFAEQAVRISFLNECEGISWCVDIRVMRSARRADYLIPLVAVDSAALSGTGSTNWTNPLP